MTIHGKRVWVLVAGLLLGGATLLRADVPTDRPPHGPEGPAFAPGARLQALATFVRNLDLTPEQRHQVRPIIEEACEALKIFMNEHKDQLTALRDAVRAAVQAQDRPAVREAREKIKAIMDAAPRFEGVVVRIRAVLTDEQKAKLAAWLQERREYVLQHRPNAPGDAGIGAGQ